MFSCEFCEISKNTFLTEHLRATASADKPYFQSGPFKSSQSRVFCKNGVLKTVAIFTGNHLCWTLLDSYKTRNHPKPSKTTHNRPKPLTTSQNKPKPPTTSQNQPSAKIKNSYPKPPSTKWRLQHSCFPVKLANIFRTPFLQKPPVAAFEHSKSHSTF